MRDRLRVCVLFLVIGWLGLAASSARAQTGGTTPAEGSGGSYASSTSTPSYDYSPHAPSSTFFPATSNASNDNTFGVAFGGFILACAAGALVYMAGAGFQHLVRGSGRPQA